MSGSGVIWHDVECGSYNVDLPLWEKLAERQGGPVLDLGCGTGRVALHLARRGHRVIGVDCDSELLEALAERGADFPLEPLHADAADFAVGEELSLVLAPMQLLQLLAGREQRLGCLRCAAASLRRGGLFAAAIVEWLPKAIGDLPPLPDVREVDGRIYSSLPIAAEPAGERIVLRRLRQTVSLDGELGEEENVVLLQALSAATLEVEARSVGLEAVDRRLIPATDAHVGSTVVLLERSA